MGDSIGYVMLFIYNVRFTSQEAIYLDARLLTEHYILTNYLILENGIEKKKKKESLYKRAFTDYIYIYILWVNILPTHI